MLYRLASLNRSWQSKEGTLCALEMAGIEPTSSKLHVTGPHSCQGAVDALHNVWTRNFVEMLLVYMQLMF